MTRYIDLKRLNLEKRFQKTITRKADGQIWILPPNDVIFTYSAESVGI